MQLGLEALDLKCALIRLLLRQRRRPRLLLQPRAIEALLLQSAVEVAHLREHLLVVLAQRFEARVEVLVALLEQHRVKLALLELSPQLGAHGAIGYACRQGAAGRAEVGGLRHRLFVLVLGCLGTHHILLQRNPGAQLLECAVLVLQHLEQRAHVARPALGATAASRGRPSG